MLRLVLVLGWAPSRYLHTIGRAVVGVIIAVAFFGVIPHVASHSPRRSSTILPIRPLPPL